MPTWHQHGTSSHQAVKRNAQSDKAKELHNNLPHHLQRAKDFGSEKGASRWLMTLPIAEHNFALHKGTFRDALCLRYGWQPSRLPSHYVCGVTCSTADDGRKALTQELGRRSLLRCVYAHGFGGNRQSAFFFMLGCSTLSHQVTACHPLTATYRHHETLKRRCYEQRIREIEHGLFTPLVFSATGCMASAATIAYKRLASLLAEKR